jgi:single-strand DNA-binding protein
MANDTNSVILIGRLTRESELKFTNSGTAVSHFSLAVNRMRMNGDQREEEVSFFDCTLWGKQAESLNPYLSKGRQVCVNGELRQNRWEQDGQSRSKVEINVGSLQLLGGSQDSLASASQPSQERSYRENRPSTQPESRRAPVQQGFPGPEEFDSDIPF